MRHLSLASSTIALMATLMFARPALADEADRLFAEGAAAFEAGKSEEALKSFQAAWALRKSYDLAAGLAQAELALGKNRDAAEHLSYALRNFAVTAKPEKREPLEKALTELKTKLVTLHIHVNVEGAEVRINGVRIGRAPVDTDVFADAGSVTIVASAEGYDDAKQSLEGQKGQTQEVTLSLMPKAQSTAVPAYVAFGAGGVGLVLGIVTAAIGGVKAGDVAAACGPTKHCPDSIRGDYDTALALSRVATGGFIAAGVGAAVGGTLLVVQKRGAAPSASLVFGPGYVGVKGAF